MAGESSKSRQFVQNTPSWSLDLRIRRKRDPALTFAQVVRVLRHRSESDGEQIRFSVLSCRTANGIDGRTVRGHSREEARYFAVIPLNTTVDHQRKD